MIHLTKMECHGKRDGELQQQMAHQWSSCDKSNMDVSSKVKLHSPFFWYTPFTTFGKICISDQLHCTVGAAIPYNHLTFWLAKGAPFCHGWKYGSHHTKHHRSSLDKHRSFNGSEFRSGSYKKKSWLWSSKKVLMRLQETKLTIAIIRWIADWGGLYCMLSFQSAALLLCLIERFSPENADNEIFICSYGVWST